jgi:hypothetical protein
MKENIVPMGFRVTPEFRKRIQHAAVERGITLQDLFAEAMRFYLDAGAGEGASGKMKPLLADLTPVQQRWVTLLVAYLKDTKLPYKDQILGVLATAMGVPAPQSSSTSNKRAG